MRELTGQLLTCDKSKVIFWQVRCDIWQVSFDRRDVTWPVIFRLSKVDLSHITCQMLTGHMSCITCQKLTSHISCITCAELTSHIPTVKSWLVIWHMSRAKVEMSHLTRHLSKVDLSQVKNWPLPPLRHLSPFKSWLTIPHQSISSSQQEKRSLLWGGHRIYSAYSATISHVKACVQK